LEATLPASFVLLALLLGALLAEAARKLSRPWSRPAAVLYFTVGLWYLGDFIYNGPDTFSNAFEDTIIDDAFLEVCLFLIGFRVLLEILWPLVVSSFGSAYVKTHSDRGAHEGRLLSVLLGIWIVLLVVALIRVEGDFWSVFFPPLSATPVYMWARSGVGGSLDFLVSAFNYVHLACCGMLGAVAAITLRRRIRWIATLAFLVAVLPFLFQRARNLMLAVLMPALLAYLLVARASPLRKVVLAVTAFILISTWFHVVENYRNTDQWNTSDFGISDENRSVSNRKHHGLDMMSELCYINDFISRGTYKPNDGEHYFAELVAFVPRPLWSNKPYIGIDYAVARGFADLTKEHGVSTSVATGIVGQGVLNFGRILGPLAAAALAAGWVCILARMWIQKDRPQRMTLFLLGLALTINMGRSITLLVVFPFVFGYLGVLVYEKWEMNAAMCPGRVRQGISSRNHAS
jgi:hypothetical protein